MGVEDLSLDDIIKQRKASKKGPPKTVMYSDKVQRGRAFQPRKRLQRGKPQQQQGRKKITDARLLITKRGNTKVLDARQKINSKSVADARQKINSKPITDARQKIQALHGQTQNGSKPGGKIPKITISNELATDKRYQSSSQVVFHVTDSSRSKTNPMLSRRFTGGQAAVRRQGTGIHIAVKNDRVTSATRSQRTASASAPTQKTEMFERLRITTINREAIKRKAMPPRHDSPPPRQERPQMRKRPVSESEDSYDDEPVYGKQQRRQQRADPPKIPVRRKQEIYQARTSSRTDRSDLRPMISKQAPKPEPEFMEMEVSSVGGSPIEGTKLQVLNLHPVVSEDDILELFSVLGAVRRARLVKAGEAEVVFIRNDDAVAAYKKYNNRDLDGQPMQIKIVASDQPKQPVQYSWMKDIKPSKKKLDPGEVTELQSGVLQQALFKGGSTGTSTRPVVFTVKI